MVLMQLLNEINNVISDFYTYYTIYIVVNIKNSYLDFIVLTIKYKYMFGQVSVEQKIYI